MLGAQETRHFVPHPLPGSPALCKLDCAAAEVLGPTGLSTCPVIRHPQSRPGRRVREASSPPTYYAWMQTGRAYSVFPSGRSRLQAGPRRRLPAPRGCPERLRSRAARPGTVRAGLGKHCWSLGDSLRAAWPKIAESCAYRRETMLVQSDWKRGTQLLASLQGWLRRQLRTRHRVAPAKTPTASGA